jgi:hypothetical protein
VICAAAGQRGAAPSCLASTPDANFAGARLLGGMERDGIRVRECPLGLRAVENIRFSRGAEWPKMTPQYCFPTLTWKVGR